MDVTLGSADKDIVLNWTPVTPNSVFIQDGTYAYYDDGAGKLMRIAKSSVSRAVVYNSTSGEPQVVVTLAEGASADEVGTVVYGTTRDANFDKDKITAKVSFNNAFGEETALSVEWLYNNVYVPQNDVPLLDAKMDAIAVTAHARRIAVNKNAA